MLHILKRHPVPIVARFEKAVTLTYAFPREILIPLLSPGLELDAYGANGFLAVATVHTTDLRPAFLPKAFGRHFFLTNYRLFTRFKPHGGKELRGLQTLRSDTDLSWLVVWGNRTTRYGYRKAEVEFANQAGLLQLDVRTPHGEADLKLMADISRPSGSLPNGSPFPDIKTAQQFAAPLVYTFDYEAESGSMIVVEGRRTQWHPHPVTVEVQQNSFLFSSRFQATRPVLASAFYLSDVPYRWGRGRREKLRG